VVGQSALDPPHDTPNFQALLYLAYLRELNPDEALSFTFFHFLETLDDAVAGEGDLNECLTTVNYLPEPFEAYVVREEVFEELREDGSGDCRKTLEPVDYGTYAEVLTEHPFPEGRTKAEVMDSELGQALHHRLAAAVGDYAYVENGCGQALRHLAHVRDSSYFVEDLDVFESFVVARLDEVNRYRSGEARVPVTGLGGEPNYRPVDHRDMLLEGEARP
jgi:hypothetical protein